MTTVFDHLTQVIESRKTAPADSSYVASLHAKGLNKILEKVGEEAVETILAARDVQAGAAQHILVSETADLWFHSLVMLSHLNIAPAAVLAELERRQGVSGLDEKASRKP